MQFYPSYSEISICLYPFFLQLSLTTFATSARILTGRIHIILYCLYPSHIMMLFVWGKVPALVVMFQKHGDEHSSSMIFNTLSLTQ